MKTVLKMALAVLLATSITSTAIAASLYTLTLPAQVTIDSGAWTLYDPTCTTVVSSINFGTVSVGGNSSATFCIRNSGSSDQWLTANSVTSTLPSADGSVTVSKVTSMSGSAFSFPLEFQPANTALLTLLLKAAATAPTSTTAVSFQVSVVAFSTSSG